MRCDYGIAVTDEENKVAMPSQQAIVVWDEDRGHEDLILEVVGVYDVSILSADEPGALLEWLHDHGYAFPEEGGPILDA